MRFAEYPWTERKLYWLNEGAHIILQLPVIRHAVWEFLFRYGQIESLPCKHADGFSFMSEWHLFAIPADERLACFFRAMLPLNAHLVIQNYLGICTIL